MKKEPEETLADIRQLMDRSTRFKSLNGFSFVAAGICGFIGAFWTGRLVAQNKISILVWLGILTLLAAVASGLFFTLIKIKKRGMPLFDMSFRKVSFSFAVPMLAGGVFIIGMLFYHQYQFIAAACLLFYGIALFSASQYTLKEIRFLGIIEIIAGIICLFIGYDIILLVLGFGVMDILFGLIIWKKYR